MIRTAALALIALAALGATPAAAQSFAQPQARQISHQQAVAQGPGGCQEFNTALAAAVATQIRTGKHAEAQRLARMAVPCPRR